jgi:hypothetical protein
MLEQERLLKLCTCWQFHEWFEAQVSAIEGAEMSQ